VSEVDPGEGTHRLFPDLSLPESKRHTYDLCAKLFNNYSLDPAVREQVAREETAEETEFIETIVTTRPMQMAKEAIAFDRSQPAS